MSVSRRRIRVAVTSLIAVAVGAVVVWYLFESLGPRARIRRVVYRACYHHKETDLAAVHQMGPDAVPYLIEVLQIRDTDTKLTRFFWRLQGNAPDWVQKWLPDSPAAATLHARAGKLLQELGPAARPALPELIRCLQAEKSEWAVEAIGGLGQDAKEALPALHAALTNRFLTVPAAAAIWDVGRETNTTLNVLMPIIRTKNKGALIEVVMAADHLDQPLRESVAATLVERLQDTNRPNERSSAAIALRFLHVPVEPTQSALLLGARDSDRDVQWSCAVTLWRLWPTNPTCASLGSRALLESAFPSKRDQHALNFVQRAKNMEIDPTTAIPALKEYLNDNDPEIRGQAAEAIRLIETSNRSTPASQ